MNKKWMYSALVAGMASAFLGLAASKATFPFANITNSQTPDAATDEAPPRVTIADPGAEQLRFHFWHTAGARMSTARVGSDDGVPMWAASIVTNSPGGSFSHGGAQPNRPGLGSVRFQQTAGFRADSAPPSRPSGVNLGGGPGIGSSGSNGKANAGGLDAQMEGFSDGGLVNNIDVNGFDGEGGKSLDTEPPTVIPLPVGAGLVLAGLTPLALRRRRAL